LSKNSFDGSDITSLFKQDSILKGSFFKDDTKIGTFSIEKVGEHEIESISGEMINYECKFLLPSVKGVGNISRSATMILSHEGKSLFYRTSGTGGSMELKILPGSKLMITLPNGQRFIKYIEKMQFFYEDYFPIQEWFAIALNMIKHNQDSSEVVFFSISNLTALSDRFSITTRNPLTIRTTFGQTMILDENLNPTKIATKSPLMDSLIIEK
jgi:hypothetical protein